MLLRLVMVLCAFGSSALAAAQVVTVYSARTEDLIKPVFEQFTKETGIKVDVLMDSAGPLMERLKAEGSKTKADLFITVDAGNLWAAAEAGLFQPTDDSTLEKNIPAHLRDPENRWTGLSLRARTIVYNTDKVKPSELSTYEALGDAEWKGRLCLRTAKKVYNQSLVAMLIEQHKPETTESIVKSWVANLDAPVFSSDTKVAEAVAAGQCDVGIINSYYYGRLMRDNPDLPIKLFWPNQQKGQGGVHVNISGAGVTKHSPNPELARKLLVWLTEDKAQRMFADANLEYPANPSVEVGDAVKAWGSFEASKMNIAKAGSSQEQAILLMDKAGYK